MVKSIVKASEATKSRMEASPALVSAVYLVLLYLGYSLCLRIVNFATLVQAEIPTPDILGPPLSLPFILGEELVIGAIAAAILAAAWRVRLMRGVWLVAFAVYLVFLAFDQLAFGQFFSHVDYALYSETRDLSNLSDSILDSMDWSFFAATALALTCSLLIALPARPRPIRTMARLVTRYPLPAGIAAAAYLGLTVAFGSLAEQRGLNRSFPVAFIESFLESRAEERLVYHGDLDESPADEQLGFSVAPDSGAADDLAPKRAPATASGRRLNVVWYLMESASYHETSLHPDARYDTTPFLAHLARESLVFTRYYSGVAASTRAFFSGQTGLYPFVDKSSNMVKYSQLQIPTLVDILHEEGYATAFFTSSDTLFDSLDTFLANRSYDAFMDANLLSLGERRRAFFGSWGVEEEIIIDKALEWIEATAATGRPFFINYNAVFPHHPYKVPSQYEGLTKMDWGSPPRHARYRAAMRYSDTALRRFYTGLDRLGLLEDTLFVVTPDHGEAFGDRHAGNLLHAGYAYDDDQHVFLLLRNPEVLDQPRRSSRLGSHADLLPTVLDVLDIERELEIDGQSLISSGYHEPTIYYFSRRQLGLQRGNHKVVVWRTGRKVELYNLAWDPQERRDISAAHPQEVAALERDVQNWRATVARAYQQRAVQTGLSGDQIRRLVKEQRRARVSGKRITIVDVGLCVDSGSCPNPAAVPVFPRGSTFTAWVRPTRAKRAELMLEIISPKNEKLQVEIKPALGEKEVRFPPIAVDALGRAGSYRARIKVTVDSAIHDLRSLRFYITD